MHTLEYMNAKLHYNMAILLVKKTVYIILEPLCRAKGENCTLMSCRNTEVMLKDAYFLLFFIKFCYHLKSKMRMPEHNFSSEKKKTENTFLFRQVQSFEQHLPLFNLPSNNLAAA